MSPVTEGLVVRLLSRLRGGGASTAQALSPLRAKPARTILIQNYHGTATSALVRDFQKLGFKVYSPADDWGFISYFNNNADVGGELISLDAYMALPPGYVLITCKLHEADLGSVASRHGDAVVLNIPEHGTFYRQGLGQVMLCPDIQTFETYPHPVEHKLLYFLRPMLSYRAEKDVEAAFSGRAVTSYISLPQVWVQGFAAYQAFKAAWPGATRLHGIESPDGPLTHADANRRMVESFFTVHFKEKEAYGLSCLESMMLGTPVVSLHAFMDDKTLGRFFLTPETAILADTVEEAVERLGALTLDQYRAMSRAASARVYALTSDARTVDRLALALQSQA